MSTMIEIDTEKDYIRLFGVRYSLAIFATLGIAPIGAVLEIVSREDGVLTVRRFSEEAADRMRGIEAATTGGN